MILSVLMVLLVLLVILAPVFAALAMAWMELRSQRTRVKGPPSLKGKQADDLRAAVVSLVPV
jgi:heme/copper-type cytochrome/quinol oxidase subunit 2